MLVKKHSNSVILADGRWQGTHGIGRFSLEVLTRLQKTDILTSGPHPLSLQNFLWQPYQLYRRKKIYQLFFTPGFNPIYSSSMPYVLTLCDLIYLHLPGRYRVMKKVFLEKLLKPSLKKAYKILTISNHSRDSILNWTNLPAEQVINVSCGISHHFSLHGEKYSPGYPYFLNVGNTNAHKNSLRLIKAFSNAKLDGTVKLIMTGKKNATLHRFMDQHHLHDRVVFDSNLSETQLASYYRGAIALVFPSLYEGFGLPLLEAMACGTPVITSNVTSLPEVAGNAAFFIDPYDVESIQNALEMMVSQNALREQLIEKGFKRTQSFSWEKTANSVQTVLNEKLTR